MNTDLNQFVAIETADGNQALCHRDNLQTQVALFGAKALDEKDSKSLREAIRKQNKVEPEAEQGENKAKEFIIK